MTGARNNFDSYSQLQLTILKWMLTPSAIISAISSACLLRLILFAADAPHRQRKTYHRLLFAISVIDIISSTALVVFTPLLYTRDIEPGPLCTIDSAIKVLGGGASVYMACLSIYFLLIIRYSVPDKKIVARYEIWFHIISLFCPLFTITWGIIDRAFNPVEFHLGCFIQEYPIGCLEDDDSTCQRGASVSTLRSVGGFLPFAGVLLVLISANLLIYWTVRKIEARVQRYDFPNNMQTSQRTSTTISATTERTRAQQPSKTKRVATQSFLFVLGYFLTYLPGLLLHAVKNMDRNGLREAKYFPLQVMFGLLWPLQGFFDFLIYVRPRYLQCRRHQSEWSRWKCFIMVAFSLEDFRNTKENNNNTQQTTGQSTLIARSNHTNSHRHPNNQITPIRAGEEDALEVPSCISAAMGERGSGKTFSEIPRDGTWDDEL